MSLRLKSEICLRLGARHGIAEVWGAGLRSRCLARCVIDESVGSLLDHALDALEATGVALPRQATVEIEDELIYHDMFPAVGRWGDALREARLHFASVLDDDRLQVNATLSPGGGHWIVAAATEDLLDGWRQALQERGIALASVRSALVEDLRALAPQVATSDGLLLLVRAEGLQRIDIRRGGVTRIEWDRCDTHDLEPLCERLVAHEGRRDPDTDDGPATSAIFVAPRRTASLPVLEHVARLRGWRLLSSALPDAEGAR